MEFLTGVKTAKELGVPYEVFLEIWKIEKGVTWLPAGPTQITTPITMTSMTGMEELMRKVLDIMEKVKSGLENERPQLELLQNQVQERQAILIKELENKQAEMREEFRRRLEVVTNNMTVCVRSEIADLKMFVTHKLEMLRPQHGANVDSLVNLRNRDSVAGVSTYLTGQLHQGQEQEEHLQEHGTEQQEHGPGQQEHRPEQQEHQPEKQKRGPEQEEHEIQERGRTRTKSISGEMTTSRAPNTTKEEEEEQQHQQPQPPPQQQPVVAREYSTVPGSIADEANIRKDPTSSMKSMPEGSGAIFEILDSLEFSRSNKAHTTAFFQRASKICKVRVSVLFDPDSKLQVRLLVSRNENTDDFEWPVKFTSYGYINNTHPTHFTAIWCIENQLCSCPHLDKEIIIEPEVCLWAVKGTHPEVTYQLLEKKGYTKDNFLRFKWAFFCQQVDGHCADVTSDVYIGE